MTNKLIFYRVSIMIILILYFIVGSITLPNYKAVGNYITLYWPIWLPRILIFPLLLLILFLSIVGIILSPILLVIIAWKIGIFEIVVCNLKSLLLGKQ